MVAELRSLVTIKPVNPLFSLVLFLGNGVLCFLLTLQISQESTIEVVLSSIAFAVFVIANLAVYIATLKWMRLAPAYVDRAQPLLLLSGSEYTVDRLKEHVPVLFKSFIGPAPTNPGQAARIIAYNLDWFAYPRKILLRSEWLLTIALLTFIIVSLALSLSGRALFDSGIYLFFSGLMVTGGMYGKTRREVGIRAMIDHLEQQL